MTKDYQGRFFKVGDEVSWRIEDSFKSALETYYILKSYSKNVKIWDAVTDKIIFG